MSLAGCVLSRGVDVPSSHFSKINVSRGKSGWLNNNVSLSFLIKTKRSAGFFVALSLSHEQICMQVNKYGSLLLLLSELQVQKERGESAKFETR